MAALKPSLVALAAASLAGCTRGALQAIIRPILHRSKHTTMTLRILATGGTFDKHYNELNGTLGFADSHLPAALARCRLTVPVELDCGGLKVGLQIIGRKGQDEVVCAFGAQLQHSMHP